MIIIGERINTSRKAMAPAVSRRDAAFVQAEARAQAAAGADMIDVNCGTFVGEEGELLPWLVQTVQAAVEIPLCLDTPNPDALARALAVHKGRATINSITAEGERWRSIIPLVKEHRARIIALVMDDDGMPETAGKRFEVAARLVGGLMDSGVEPGDIFIDPLVRPISTGTHCAKVIYETLRRIREEFPDVHTVCGLSNISFGLPCRKLINRAFLIQAMQAGLDAAILDPLDKQLMSMVSAAELLLDRDEYALRYLAAFREERLVT